jgi:hypothetical protein
MLLASVERYDPATGLERSFVVSQEGVILICESGTSICCQSPVLAHINWFSYTNLARTNVMGIEGVDGLTE